MRRLILGVLSLAILFGCAEAQTGPSAPSVTLPATSDIVRVRILNTRSATNLSCAGPYQYQLRRGGKLYVKHGSIRVRGARNTMVFDSTGLKGEVVVTAQDPANSLKLNGRKYRGTLVFHPGKGGQYDVVEYLNLDEYLYGVLPREVDPVWPADSLKAQAVVSRTYVLYNKSKNAIERFDVSATVQDQVYGGQSAESPDSNKAVDDTHGEVLHDPSGNLVQTFFHSSCGGSTETPDHVWKSANAEEVFGVVPDAHFCADDPHYHWKLTMSYSALRTRLRHAGFRVHDIKSVVIGQRSPSGRAEIFILRTSGGDVSIWGNKFRLAVGPETLRSTYIIALNPGKKSVVFEGRGWGHGVGLCQWGARGRALAGQTYQQIVEAYYPGAKLAKEPA